MIQRSVFANSPARERKLKREKIAKDSIRNLKARVKRNENKVEIYEGYVKIYRNKALSAKTKKQKQYYHKRKRDYENKIIKLRLKIKKDRELIEDFEKILE